MNDVDLMKTAVAANPNDEIARMVLADAITERTGNYAGAVTEADGVALRARIAAFVKHLDATLAAHWKEQDYTYAPPPTHEAVYISDKWCRIVRHDRSFAGEWRGGSVAAFVCLKDNVTRTLGVLKTGDVHKPASWKAAAKHARGTVWANDFGKCVGPSGHVNYLR